MFSQYIDYYMVEIITIRKVEYEDDLSYQDDRVRYFWEAISNFTNDERSKFVRFVTGRKRLPVKIYFSISDQ